MGDGGMLFPLYLGKTWEETLDNNLGGRFGDSNTCTQKTYHGTPGNHSLIFTGLFWALIIPDAPLEGVSFTYLCFLYLGFFSGVLCGMFVIYSDLYVCDLNI